MQRAVQQWFAFTTKQIQFDLRRKFQKDITSELTDWEFLDSEGEKILKPATLKIMQSGGDSMFKLLEAKGSFDVVNVNSIKAAEKFTADLVVDVNNKTKTGIRTYIRAGVKEGKSMDKIAREMRPLVGLTDTQTQSVMNYKTLLQDKEKFPNLTASGIDKKVQRYADKTHRRRTQTITRTETARAQNIGYVEGASELGIEELEFSAVIDGATSDICLGLDGNRYKLSEARGVIPAHPNCRSALLPVVDNKTPSKKDIHNKQVTSLTRKLKDKPGDSKLKSALINIGGLKALEALVL